MPTFDNPVEDAMEASAALRGLAHATRTFTDPAETYPVLGELLAGVRSLRQVLDQLAAAHISTRSRAHTDAGSQPAGATAALAAADELHQAGTLLDQAHDHLDRAFSCSGRIAWHPAVTADGPTAAPAEPVAAGAGAGAAQRWVSVVFLQGEDADAVLDLIDRDGPAAAIEHLRQWDYGEETTDAALSNGYVYDEPPTGTRDRTVAEGDYTLTYDPAHGHVSLLRRHHIPAEDVLPDTGPEGVSEVVPAREAIGGIGAATPTERRRDQPQRARGRRAPDPSWFEHPGVAAVKQSRGLSL